MLGTEDTIPGSCILRGYVTVTLGRKVRGNLQGYASRQTAHLKLCARPSPPSQNHPVRRAWGEHLGESQKSTRAGSQGSQSDMRLVRFRPCLHCFVLHFRFSLRWRVRWESDHRLNDSRHPFDRLSGPLHLRPRAHLRPTGSLALSSNARESSGFLEKNQRLLHGGLFKRASVTAGMLSAGGLSLGDSECVTTNTLHPVTEIMYKG